MIDADALVKCVNKIFGLKPDARWSHGAVLNTIDAAPTVGGWISVNDKLPDKQGVYLVAFKPPFPKVTIAWWATTEFGWYDLEYNFHTDGVSHWMPLPPMPKEVTEE